MTVADTFKPVSRYWDRITKPAQIVRSLPQALAVMLDPATRGPAFFALPQDVQAEAYDFPERVLRAEGPLHPATGAGSTGRRGRRGPHRARAASAHHRGRRRPLLGRRRTPCGPSPSATRIPVVETVAGKSTLTHDHPNYAGPIGVTGSRAANAVAEQADVVIAVGTRLQDFTTGSWSVFKDPDVRFVAVNTASWDAHKQGAQPVIGDAKVALEAIGAAPRCVRGRRPSGWRRRTSASPSGTSTSIRGPGDSTTVRRPMPRSSRRSTTACDPGDYIVSAAGGLPGELAMGWRSKSVGSFDSEYGYSTMGYEIAGAWGARLARPTGDVIAWVGDGSYLMMNSDIYSTVMTGQKVIFMVCDNGGFAVINRLQVNTGGEEFNNLLRTTRHERYLQVDFVKHAESMGAIAERVESVDDLPAAFARAKAADRSYVIVDPGRRVHLDRGWRLVGGRRPRGQRARAGSGRSRGVDDEQAATSASASDPVGDFDGRVVIVTGAASFLGEALGAILIAEGASVLLADRDAEHGAAVAARLGAAGAVRPDGRLTGRRPRPA